MSEVTDLSSEQVTFSVWPENADHHYDIMNMYIDGHFRPAGYSRSEAKGKGKAKGKGQERGDIFRPQCITTEQRILDMASDRQSAKGQCPAWYKYDEDFLKKGKGKSGEKGKGRGKGKGGVDVVASRVSEPCVIDTGGSTMEGGGGLLQTVHMAYNFEKDLIITPDDVLLTIMAGVGSHISSDPEKYRHIFVEFEGRKEIEVECDDPPRMWEESGVFEQFNKKIRDEAVDRHHFHEALTCDFSTTTPLEKMLCQLGVMDATRSYFDFSVAGMCGIKSVTLKGTEEDWRSLRQKIDALTILTDLEWWLGDLKLILDQFVRARAGHISSTFWRRMIKGYHADKGVYEDEAFNCHLTGWVLAFFPYTRNGTRVCSRSFTEQQAEQRSLAELGVCTECGTKQTSGETGCGDFYCAACWQAYDLMRHWRDVTVSQEEVPDGMMSASIKWTWCGQKVGDVRVYGGVVGPNVPSDKFAPMQTVRGYVMDLHRSEE